VRLSIARRERPDSVTELLSELDGIADWASAIGSRTLADDYQNFFNGTSQVGQTNSVTNIGRLTQSQKNSPLSNVLSDQVDVVVGDTLTPDAPLTSFPSSGDEGDRNRVRLQLQLGE